MLPDDATFLPESLILDSQPLTRLAPSPTGALHLGNARTFLINWLLARQNGWKILLRIEDLDGPRIKPESAEQAMADLRWLGIDWDDGPIYQSARRAIYKQAVDQLIQSGDAYACICTRKEVELAASAPHAEDGAAVYPGSCRGRFSSAAEAAAVTGRPPAIRFRVPEGIVKWTDQFAGPQQCDVGRQLGDFIIAKADNTPAYQLSVVVDDVAAGVTHIVRGDDLLDSTPRQILLYHALNRADAIPTYYHLPLVIGTDGRRLAKRHGDTRLSYFRESGVSANAVLAILSTWCGIADVADPTSAEQLLSRFAISKLPKTQIIFDSKQSRLP